MNSVRSGVSPALFGSKGHVGVSRGLAEFHGRRPVLITAKNETLLALPVEGLDTDRLTAFVALCAPRTPHLIVTARRALALGLDARTPMALRLSPTTMRLRSKHLSVMRLVIVFPKQNLPVRPLQRRFSS
jgi:GTP cyclohydrolase II